MSLDADDVEQQVCLAVSHSSCKATLVPDAPTLPAPASAAPATVVLSAVTGAAGVAAPLGVARGRAAADPGVSASPRPATFVVADWLRPE